MGTAAKPYVVVGCKATGETHPRIEIRELVQNPFQFSLFIRAWSKISDPGYRPDDASFRAIGGIHGLPYQEWSGDPNEKPVTDDSDPSQWLGYCYHATILFPTWHRPLMLCIEQAVSEAAIAIAAEDEKVCKPQDKGKWTQAAKELRFPFWDWTNPDTGKQGFPVVNGKSMFGEPTITVLDSASGNYVENTNPLYTFNFGDSTPEGFVDSPPSFFKSWNRTYRWPTSQQSNPKEQLDLLNQTFTSANPVNDEQFQPYQWLASKIQMLFKVPPGMDTEDWPSMWDRFSNTSPQEQRIGNVYSGPLEEPHNQVHTNIGGNGHMSDPAVAGFDPAFYMHHCNVDRILAFWEAVYPDYWMGKGWYDSASELQPFAGTAGTYVMLEGEAIDENTALAPFRKDETSYWTSKDVRFLSGNAPFNKYYTYNPIEGVDVAKVMNSEERVAALYKLQDYFSPTSKIHALPFNKLPPMFDPPAQEGMKGVPDSASPVDKFRHFVIQGNLDPHAFNGSYIVAIVLAQALGNIPAGTVIDKISVFVRKDPENCPNCASRQARGGKFNAIANIPMNITVALIRERGIDQSDKEGDEANAEFLGHLKGVFDARIESPGGQILAERPLVGDGAEEEHGEWMPTFELVSAAASTPKEVNSETPTSQFFLHDWQKHGELMQGGWNKA